MVINWYIGWFGYNAPFPGCTIRYWKICVLYKQKVQGQLMGVLPPERITISRLFFTTGLDFAGPFDISLHKYLFLIWSAIEFNFIICKTCGSNRAELQVTLANRALLQEKFPGGVISRLSDVSWPARSCDLTPFDFFLWVCVHLWCDCQDIAGNVPKSNKKLTQMDWGM